jgi:hypothetical protein
LEITSPVLDDLIWYKTMLLAGNLLRAFSNGVDLRRKAYPLPEPDGHRNLIGVAHKPLEPGGGWIS